MNNNTYKPKPIVLYKNKMNWNLDIKSFSIIETKYVSESQTRSSFNFILNDGLEYNGIAWNLPEKRNPKALYNLKWDEKYQNFQVFESKTSKVWVKIVGIAPVESTNDIQSLELEIDDKNYNEPLIYIDKENPVFYKSFGNGTKFIVRVGENKVRPYYIGQKLKIGITPISDQNVHAKVSWIK